MTYESCGNIASKSDLSPGIYTYGHSTKPFAVTGINSGNEAIPSADQVATYTSFEQVSTINEDNYYAIFTYNSDNQRCKMLITDLGSTILTRWYVGSRYIKEDDNGTITEYTWIGGDAYSAPIVAETLGSTTNYYYLLRDYLGNITHKVNTSNTVVAQYSYDAWGRRRDKDDWGYNLSGEPDLTAGRGFTSHEYLACFNIVNMNGRLYDPLVGRFLSPDENVQMPDFTQNFNRYSYCLNNPLVYTDPTGEFIFTALCAVIPGAQVLLPIAIGADLGAVTGAIRGANSDVGFWGGALRGTVVGAVGGVLSMVGGAGMSFGANLAFGTGSGAITGGLDAALWGNDIGQGMLWGAATGAIFTTLTSDNFSNWTKGEGFYTNENVFNHMMERGMDKQAMLDYFGFEGKYTGTTKGPNYADGGGKGTAFLGSTNPKTGAIQYGDLAFDSYDKLEMTYHKEMYHSIRVKNGIPLETQQTMLGKHTKYFPEERLGFIHAYKNQGLYPSHGTNIMSNISYYQLQSINLNPAQYYTAKWWHFIYKIPRRW